MAEKNARLALQQRAREKATQEGRIVALREALGLPETAQRIECFDISHTMGEAAVASCVVYDRHAMQKAQYRRFNMRELTPGDDYAAMRQALTRRYERVLADEGKVPDLILIDGGRGQLNAARAALAELGLNDVMVVGVAKGPERKAGMEELVLEAEGQSLSLPPQHPGLHLIQSIRDEAHRFAIVGHRAQARQGAHHLVADRDSGHRRQAPPEAARPFRRPAGRAGRRGRRTRQGGGRQPRAGRENLPAPARR